MGYAQRLITRILADEQARGNATAAQRVYRDEPILRTGADLLRERSAGAEVRGPAGRPARTGGAARGRSGQPRPRPASRPESRNPFPPFAGSGASDAPGPGISPAPDGGAFAESAIPRPAAACELPPLLQKLRALQRELDAHLVPEGKAFVQQALLAAAYEDDYPYDGVFQHYFPTYRHMTDEQLRGYFSWRTRVRRGQVRRTSLSFAFVHLYELVNGIGPAGRMEPREGYAALQGFCRAYGEIDARILRYARAWCRDYAVYHGLDAALPPTEQALEEALRTLREVDEADAEAPPDDEALFDALARLSSYRIDRSRLMKERAPLLKAAVCRTWRALSAYFRAHRKSTLSEHLFGTVAARPYAMFGAAVFWQEGRHPDCRRQAGPLTRFVCEDGRWLREGPYRALGPSREAGALLKAVDATLRTRLGCDRPLKGASVPKYAQRIVDRQVEDLLAEERQRQEQEAEAWRRRVDIDFSKLASIRAEAAASREALLTDEERGESGGALPDPQAGTQQAEKRPQSPAPAIAKAEGGAKNAPAAPFSPVEAAYLRLLLAKAPAGERHTTLQTIGISETMMIDVINEKALDKLGDIIVEEGATGPELLEDYVEDVRSIVERRTGMGVSPQ